ncbi:MAG: exopolyphosphatase/guanosine-5'-triphosphate,3'-diphosphate pyrophosphatase [Halioglobus sp.]
MDLAHLVSTVSDFNEVLPEGSLLAALDLGSNSFHLIIARVEHGEMRTIETLAEKVQLGAGLIDGQLAEDAIKRGLDCLSRFSQMMESMDIQRVRAVGTHALRIAKNRRHLTVPGSKILGVPVDVIYGREEARLVYLGVAHSLADDAQSRLVVDIGGGSTEFIIGEKFEPKYLESLEMGCVSYSNKFFPDGEISASAYQSARDKALLEIFQIRRQFSGDNWKECVGSSGTLQAIEELLVQQGWSDAGITSAGLAQLEDKLLSFEDMDSIALEGLAESRRNVIVAGVAITSALFYALQIEHMRTSKGALREGVLYDLLGRLTHEDVRERTVNALMQRYSVDGDIAASVERRARVFFNATRNCWKLNHSDWFLLRWVANSHEIGMAISHKHYNRHSSYLLRNADLPGFSQDEQEDLALLARGHRGKLNQNLLSETAEQDRPRFVHLLSIIRLAALFRYVEKLEQLPEFTISASEKSLVLGFGETWLAEHPLTVSELAAEQHQLQKIGMSLEIS